MSGRYAVIAMTSPSCTAASRLLSVRSADFAWHWAAQREGREIVAAAGGIEPPSCIAGAFSGGATCHARLRSSARGARRLQMR